MTKTKVFFFSIARLSNSVGFFQDTEKEDGGEPITNGTTKIPTLTTTTESIEFDNGLKLDLSSIDGDSSDPHTRRRSIDFDYEAINRSNARVGDWETNFTLIESKVLSIYTRSSLFFSSCFSLLIPAKNPRVVLVKVST